MSTTIKFNYNNTLKILNIPSNQLCYQYLLETFARIYNLPPKEYSLNLETKEHVPITHQQLLQISSMNGFLYCSYFETESDQNEIKSVQRIVQNEIKSDQRMTKHERIVQKYSKLKLYEKLDIKEDQIEIYKNQLIELHYMGYKRFCFNLKYLVQFGKDNDFSEAVKMIKEAEDQRIKRNKRNVSNDRKNWKKKMICILKMI
jgi:hypothetical protein